MKLARIFGYLVLAHKRPMRSVRRRGIRWQLDLRETIDFSIYLTGYFQRPVINQIVKLIPNDAVVIDIGANRGSMSIQIARLCSRCKLFAVEPADEMIHKMRDLIHANPGIGSRIHVEQIFLASGSSIGDEQRPHLVDASWSLFDVSQRNPLTGATAVSASQCVVETLDSLVKRNSLRRVDLIKLDVDGYELGVLQGGSDTFLGLRPIVVSEWAPYSLFQRGVSPDNVLELWRSYGYTSFRIRRFGRPIQISWRELLAVKHHDSMEILLLPN
jgi:FkbM family methyltransferase